MKKRSFGKDSIVESTRRAKVTFRGFPESKEYDFDKTQEEAKGV